MLFLYITDTYIGPTLIQTSNKSRSIAIKYVTVVSGLRKMIHSDWVILCYQLIAANRKVQANIMQLSPEYN